MPVIGPVRPSRSDAHSCPAAVRRGLTLVEAVIAMVILPVAVTAIALAVVAGQSQAVEAMRQARANMLAEALMDEILALPYGDPDGDPQGLGPESGETSRALYDNSDDYCGKSIDADAGNVVKDATGTSYPTAMQKFRRTVTCSNSPVTITGLVTAAAGLTVTVTVTQDGNTVTSITRFIRESD